MSVFQNSANSSCYIGGLQLAAILVDISRARLLHTTTLLKCQYSVGHGYQFQNVPRNRKRSKFIHCSSCNKFRSVNQNGAQLRRHRQKADQLSAVGFYYWIQGGHAVQLS